MLRLSYFRVLPGLLFCFIALLLVAGREKLPPQLVYRYLQADPARAEQILRDAEATLGNGGWLRHPIVSERAAAFPEPDLSVQDVGSALAFAQIGDGQIPGTQQFFQTTLILVNQTGNSASGTIEFYDNDGLPLVVTIDGVADSAFPFQLQSRQTKRFQTAGTGDVKVGWAHVHSSQPVGGTATFGMRDNTGRIYTDIGVEESPVGKEFMLYADMVGNSRTAMALANPSGSPIDIQVQLFQKTGTLKSTGSIHLPAWGHSAQFLDELFKDVSGIQEFEGSAVVTSPQDFHGITLRSTGDQLTSMPMLGKPPAGAAWTKIAFAHLGDGTAGDLSITSSIVLMNNLESRAEGVIEFHSSDGTEMVVNIGGTQSSEFSFSLDANGVARFVTGGAGDLKTGYAVVSMDQPINGTALFSIYNKGALDSEAGIGATPLQKKLTIIADSLDLYNTGIAVAYPIPSDVSSSNSISMTLYDHNGDWRGSKSLTLQNFEHSAGFITDLFPDVDGIDEFDGYVDISAGQYAAFLCLRQAGAKLTSMPYFRKSYGFAPTSTLRFAQNLAGAVSPAATWRLVQQGNDFALENVRLSSSGLGFNPAGIVAGDRIGFGQFVQDEESRTFELIARSTGAETFDLIEFSSDGTSVIGAGTIDGAVNGNLQVQIQFLNKQPFSYVGSEVQTDFWLVPGLLQVPANAGSVTVNSEFTSVSTELDVDRPLLRRTSQQLAFVAPSASLANLFEVSPVFLRPGVTARLEGTRFGSNPLAIFNFEQLDWLTGQSTELSFPIIAEEDSDGWSARVPVIVGSTPDLGFLQLKSIQVDNGSGAGNLYECGMNFAPGFQVHPDTTLGGDTTQVSFTFNQAQGQLALIWFQVGFFNVSTDFSGLAAEDDIGTGTYGEDHYQLIVKSVAPTEVIVDVVEAGYTDAFGELKLERFPGADPDERLPDLGLTFRMLEPPEGPQLLSSPLRLDWSLTGVPITLPQAGSVVQVSGNTLSAPATGSSAGHQVDFDTHFQTGTE